MLKFPNLNKNINLLRPKSYGERFLFSAVLFLFCLFSGFLGGFVSSRYFYLQIEEHPSGLNLGLPLSIINKETAKVYVPQTLQESAVIKVVKDVSPSVVSIIVSKDLPVFETFYLDPFEDFENFFWPAPFNFQVPQQRQKGTERKEIGGGTGFIISSDGMILTNKHVVLDKDASYTVLTNDGSRIEASVLAIDPFQDLAIIKVETDKELIPVKLGDSSMLQAGQTVIAIGNALGEFRNTVSVGVVSGLERRISVSGAGMVETLENIIQTDAAISKGNSGGPLLDLKGEVIGINTAMSLEVGAQDIGFAIPINKAKRDIRQVKDQGEIVYPFLGVRYILITPEIQSENDLSVDYGAWVVKGEGVLEPAVTPGSSAEKAGLQEWDIILEFNNERIGLDNPLSKSINNHNPGDEITLKVLREGKEEIISVSLGRREE